MHQNLVPLLIEHIPRGVDLGADEIRFVSGQLPGFRVQGQLRPSTYGPASSGLILAMHEECMSRSKRKDLLDKHRATYLVDFENYGEFRCELTRQGAASSLVLLRQNHEPQVAEAAPAGRPPQQAEEAAPKPPRDELSTRLNRRAQFLQPPQSEA